MIKDLRNSFNNSFSEEKYNHLQNDLNSLFKWPADFRISETPFFLSGGLKADLIQACDEISGQLLEKDFIENSKQAVPENLSVPGETSHPLFLQIDFAVAADENGNPIPQLIELQGFPSLYGYQFYLNRMFKKHYDFLSPYTPYFSNLSEEAYVAMLKEIIVGGEDPENVVLMEIHPEKQKTRIDFAATEELTGISTVCLTSVIKKGNSLFYKNDGKEIPIKRIYNRVIFDELSRSKINYGFDLRDNLDVEWAGHPNWFFRISKHSLPSLKGKYVPECYFLNENYPENLSDFVLKPLYSFAGLGVEVDFTKERLDSIEEKQNYILQKKVNYLPIIETPDQKSKVEIRMMFLWKENESRPMLVNNLVRMSKGKMMGVDFNKNKTWVGSSLAYHT